MNLSSPVSRHFLLVLLLLFGLTGFSRVSAQQPFEAVKKWEGFDFRGNSITVGQISALELDDLKLLRGIVFGKHGRVFKDFDIRSYLESRPWYKADPSFQNSALNDTERA